MIKKLIWESNFFNKQIYDINLKKFSSENFKKIIKNLKFSLISTKIGSEESDQIKTLQSCGFKIVSTSSVYEKNKIGNKIDNYQLATLDNFNELKLISKNIFIYSRIKDFYYGKGSQNRFYSHWIKESIKGNFDDCCILIMNNRKKINGFVTLKIINNHLKIGLFGIPKMLQYKGYGLKLLQVINYYKFVKNIKKSIITTQSDNLSAINVFLKDDYSFKENFVWLYLKR